MTLYMFLKAHKNKMKLELASIKSPGAGVYKIWASKVFKATEIYALNTMDDICLMLEPK